MVDGQKIYVDLWKDIKVILQLISCKVKLIKVVMERDAKKKAFMISVATCSVPSAWAIVTLSGTMCGKGGKLALSYQ